MVLGSQRELFEIPEDITYLKQQGVSDGIVQEMQMRRPGVAVVQPMYARPVYVVHPPPPPPVVGVGLGFGFGGGRCWR